MGADACGFSQGHRVGYSTDQSEVSQFSISEDLESYDYLPCVASLQQQRLEVRRGKSQPQLRIGFEVGLLLL